MRMNGILRSADDVIREIICGSARRAVDEFNERTPDKPRFVAGSIGPTAKQTAISTQVEDAAHRDVDYMQMVDSYRQQVQHLVEAGVDLLLPETAIDTLTSKHVCLPSRTTSRNRGVAYP